MVDCGEWEAQISDLAGKKLLHGHCKEKKQCLTQAKFLLVSICSGLQIKKRKKEPYKGFFPSIDALYTIVCKQTYLKSRNKCRKDCIFG
jgi:hypothetical protein